MRGLVAVMILVGLVMGSLETGCGGGVITEKAAEKSKELVPSEKKKEARPEPQPEEKALVDAGIERAIERQPEEKAQPEPQPEPVIEKESCQPGAERICYTEREQWRNKGICKDGKQTCTAEGVWGSCEGEVVHRKVACSYHDENCNGVPDNTEPCCKTTEECIAANGPGYVCDSRICRRMPARCGKGLPPKDSNASWEKGYAAGQFGVIHTIGGGKSTTTSEFCTKPQLNSDGTPRKCEIRSPCLRGYVCKNNVCHIPITGGTYIYSFVFWHPKGPQMLKARCKDCIHTPWDFDKSSPLDYQPLTGKGYFYRCREDHGQFEYFLTDTAGNPTNSVCALTR